tara:strand:+ start:971 stop:1138 length:168 start_codon:yes stop_codon:yes gene_type:complete
MQTKINNDLLTKGIEMALVDTIKKSATPLKMHISNNRASVIAKVIMNEWEIEPKN